MIAKLLASILIGFILIGCGTPKIDSSSDEKLKSSIQKIKESLASDQQKVFEESLQIVLFSQINLGNVFMGVNNPLAFNNLTDSLKASLNNKTAEDIILEAKKIKEAKLEAEKKKALEEIKQLEDKKLYAEQSKEQLKKIEISNALFYQVEEKYSVYKKPIINFTVKNLTDKAISRIYCIGTVRTPGREIPWIKEDFNYIIAGGLEPNEVAKWSLAPNMFSKWGTINTPLDAIFEIEVIGVDGSDNKSIASTRDFTEKDNIRLEELKSKFTK